MLAAAASNTSHLVMVASIVPMPGNEREARAFRERTMFR
jgi:hypothetical protein